MNVRETQSTMRQLRGELATLETAKAPILQDLDRALTAAPENFRQSDVDEARQALAKLDRQISGHNDRLRALEESLPSPEAVDEAKMNARAIAQWLEAESARFDEAWGEYMAMLEAAEESARTVNSHRANFRSAAAQLADLRNGYGITVADVPVVEKPEPPQLEQKVAYLIGVALTQVPFKPPDDVVENDLASTRRTIERANAAKSANRAAANRAAANRAAEAATKIG